MYNILEIPLPLLCGSRKNYFRNRPRNDRHGLWINQNQERKNGNAFHS